MTSAERKAVGFFAVLAATGAGARALGLGDLPGVRPPTAADRLALQHQLEAVDSLHAHTERGRAGKRAGKRSGARAARGRRASDSTSPPQAAASELPAQRPLPREPRGPVDVNQADTAELNTLPGVGPSLARRIVADRAARGRYASTAELSRVPGIGPALERRLAGVVTYGGVTFTGSRRPSSGSAPRPAGAPGGWPDP